MDREALLRGIESARQRARWTRALLVLIGVVCLAALINDVATLEFLGRVKAGTEFTVAEGEVLDRRSVTVLWFGVGLTLIAMLVWLIWVHRATANLRLAGSGASRFSPGWAVGWHFVPVMNLFRVPQVMHDLEARSADGNVRAENRASHAGLVVAWWLLFWVSHTAGRLLLRAMQKAEGVDEVIRGTEFAVVKDMLVTVTLILAWLVVRRIDRLQREALVLAPPSSRPSAAGSSVAYRPVD